jgi:hypothetical protein
MPTHVAPYTFYQYVECCYGTVFNYSRFRRLSVAVRLATRWLGTCKAAPLSRQPSL